MRLTAPLLALVLGLSLAAGCGEGHLVVTGPASPEAGTQTWTALGALPLSRRAGPVVAWTGTEVLVVGGDTGDPCPPTADCSAETEAASDGAAYDPAAKSWRPIAAAPRSLPAYHGGTYVDGHLFVAVGGRLLDYDVAADSWRTLPREISDWYATVADGDRLVLVSGSDENGVRPDLAYDVATGRWSDLPADPLGPAYDRELTWTPSGLVLTGRALDSVDDEDPPLLAAVLDRSGRWRRLPDGEGVTGGYWAWTGERMVSANMAMDPSSDRPDMLIPLGARLDPATGTWSDLPDLPRRNRQGWPVGAAGVRMVASSGWIYDDNATRDHWRLVPRPRDAADNPGPAVWAGDTLVVVGSITQGPVSASEYDNGVWSWRVPVRD